MITVMALEAALKKARKSGLIKGSDVLIAAPRTGNLIIQRNRAYFGDIDMNTGVVSDWADNPVIKGAHVNFIVLDEISAFLEVPHEVDGSGYAHGGVEEGEVRLDASVPFTIPEPPKSATVREPLRSSGRTDHSRCMWINAESRYECEEKR